MTNTQQLQDQIKEICSELEDEYARELGYEKYPSKMGRKIFIKRMVRRAFDLGWEASLNNQSSFTSTAIESAKQEEREKVVEHVKNMNVAVGMPAFVKNLIWYLEGKFSEEL